VLKGAIFDLDGVLVDSHPVHVRAWRRLLLAKGKTLDEQDLEFILEGRKREDILRHFLGNLTPDQARLYGEEKDRLFREEASAIGTLSGVREFLSQLSRASIPMAVATCGGQDRTNYLLSSLNLREYFGVIVTGDDVREGKPDPAIYLEAATRLRRRPEDLLAIEDSVSGVRSAKTARIRCLGIAAPNRAPLLLDAGADWVLTDLLEISVDKLSACFA
jgi:HAD superfamily hydrolase (TIGR01509 family)